MPIQKPDYETDGCLEIDGKRVPIFDASCSGYIKGVTNLTHAMVQDSGGMARDQAHRITTIKVYPTVYFTLRMSGELWEHEDGCQSLKGCLLLEADPSLPNERAVHDSHLCADNGEVLAVLRTREY
jgi:hypothetical protein